MRRSDICRFLGPADRAERQALLSNTPRTLAWRAKIVRSKAEARGIVEIMRRTVMSRPMVWIWQDPYLDKFALRLEREKTRPSRVPPLPREVRLKVTADCKWIVPTQPPAATEVFHLGMRDLRAVPAFYRHRSGALPASGGSPEHRSPPRF
jgi:hypothetical protein